MSGARLGSTSLFTPSKVPWHLVLLAVSALIRVPTLWQPLTEAHAWRQTQTAFTALIYYEDGIDLLRPEIPVFGPPWVVPFEFPLFQAGGAILMHAGFEPDVAMRSLGMATMLATGFLLYRLILRVAGQTAAITSLFAFLFNPFSMLWGRTSLIEYLATACGIGFILCAMRWVDTHRPSAFLLASTLGVIGIMVKITTVGFYLLPLLAYRSASGEFAWRDWRTWTLVVMPIWAGLAWTRYADGVKATSDATAWLTSSALTTWNFGRVADRIDPATLLPIINMLFTMTGSGLIIWVVLAFIHTARTEQRPFTLAFLAIAGFAPLIVITPLYSVHDYYFVAISPAVALSIGLGAAYLLTRWRRLHLARATLTALCALWFMTAVLTIPYWGRIYDSDVDVEQYLGAANFIRDRASSSEWVVVSGRDWNPAVLYYARRRGYALGSLAANRTTVEELAADPRYGLIVDCPIGGQCVLVEAATD